MRRLWLLVLLGLFGAIPAFAQSTSVSGTIVDDGSQVWFGGTVQFTFRPADSNPTSQYFWNGAPFDKNTTIPAAPLQLDGSGAFSGVSVPSSNFITPSGSTWTVQVCPAATTQCFAKNLSITGGTQDISSSLVPPAVVMNLTVPLLGARAYTDGEVVGAAPGTDYFNVTDNRLHVCLFSGFPPCTWFVLNGGAGMVTSVSSGNFSPLFNVTVTNPTTTPAFSFSAQNAAPGTIFGNPGGELPTFDQSTTAVALAATTASTPTLTPTGSEWAIMGEANSHSSAVATFTPNGGWTSIGSGLFGQVVSSPISAGGSFSAFATDYAMGMALFKISGVSAPTLLQIGTIASGSIGGTNNFNFTNPVTAGSTILVVVVANITGGSGSGIGVVDGVDTFTPVVHANQTTGSNNPEYIIYDAPNVAGGTPTITAGPGTGFSSGSIIAYEFQGAVAPSAPPAFYSPSAFSNIGTVKSISTSGCLSGGPITMSGTITSSTCVTAVNGTANQIASSGGTTPTISLPSTVIAPGSVRATTALRGATVTDDGLTVGGCVQAGTAGLLTTPTSNPCSNVGPTQIETAVISSPCTPPSANSFDACPSTVTWPHSFADTSYNVVCNAFGPSYNLGDPATNVSNLIFVSSVTVSNAVIIIQNARGAQNTPNAVLCIAAHP